ncbi:MAG: aminopeptidase [Spirochaetales bacterium]|nr:aminopeptidase [Spirochaetales bacterium]
MNSDFEKNLEKYAEIIVTVGLNIQPGQRLIIGTPFNILPGTHLDLAPLVRLVATHAYKAGARLVEVMWNDEQMELIRFKHAPRDSFEEYPIWRSDAAFEAAKSGDAILIFAARTPELLEKQDAELIATTFRTTSKYMKPTIDLRSKNSMNLTIAAAPVSGWSDKVFPGIPAETREARSWDTIFDICRIKEPDPVSAWKNHIAGLAARCDYLNKKQFVSLKLTAPGTDLSIGLPRNHIWTSAHQTTKSGIECIGNLPTEEIFTMPHKDKTEGFVSTTKPLGLGGGLVEDIVLTFREGKVVNATAGKGEESLQKLLEMDEGILRLGEIALVPHSSPISQTGLLFYSILIDENASDHIALGRAYRRSVEGGVSMSDTEFTAAGGNSSLGHIDLMIGSGSMNVDGILENGSIETIMKSGEWTFQV